MKLRKISLAVLSVLLSAIAALSGFMVYTQLSDRQKEKEEFDTLAEMVEVTPEKPNDETAVPTDETSEPVRDLSGLFSQNGDCIGWLCIPDTQLSYPVMHTPDNPQKYLRRSFYGEYSLSGVPFLDWRCDLQSDHLIVYGHNMKNGTMFSSLRNYTDPAFCAEHPVIEFQTADGVEQYTVFAVAAVQKTDTWYSFAWRDPAQAEAQKARLAAKRLAEQQETEEQQPMVEEPTAQADEQEHDAPAFSMQM